MAEPAGPSEHTNAVLDAAPVACACLDRAGQITHWNHKAARLFGIPAAQARGRHLAELVFGDRRRDEQARELAQALAGEAEAAPEQPSTWLLRRSSGQEFAAQVTLAATAEPGREPVLHLFIEDTPARSLDSPAGAALSELEAGWFLIPDLMLCEATFEGYFTRLSPSWERTLGFARQQLLARPYLELVHPDDAEPTRRAFARLALGHSELTGLEHRCRTRSGQWRWLLWSAHSDDRRIYAVAKDVTEHKQLDAEREALLDRMAQMARTDPLTGLLNRRAWDEELPREMSRARRRGHQLTVGLVDLDYFKQYNDRHGHQQGDELLRRAAAAWQRQLRDTDVLARYGGDEFALLLPACTPAESLAVIDRLREVTPAGQSHSSGLATWNGQEPPDLLLKRADAALYVAKRSGRQRSVLAGTGSADPGDTRPNRE